MGGYPWYQTHGRPASVFLLYLDKKTQEDFLAELQVEKQLSKVCEIPTTHASGTNLFETFV